MAEVKKKMEATKRQLTYYNMIIPVDKKELNNKGNKLADEDDDDVLWRKRSESKGNKIVL